MLNTIILFVLLIIVIICGEKTKTNWGWNGWAAAGSMLFGVLFLLSLIQILYMPVSFNSWVAKRDAFESTLIESRLNGNELETAAIVGKVAEWNESLAESKVWKETWLLNQYIDDRIYTLKPIK